ncbi:MAG: methyl-accepting chemotaxis protein [Paracoccaceae bacterium]|nr:methyl-accepting chemotaxis protein [Paracoccaceae bacterium]
MTVTTLIVAGVLVTGSTRVVDSLVREAVADRATATVSFQSDALVQPIRFKAQPKIEETADEAVRVAGEDGEGVMIFGGDGAVLAERAVAPSLSTTLSALAARAIETGESAASPDGLHLAAPVLLPDGTATGAIAMAFTDANALRAVSGKKITILLVGFAVMLGMSVLTLLALRRMIGKPLRDLGMTMTAIAGGDYDQDVQMRTRGDELGDIARDLDLLAEKLRESSELEAARQEEHRAQADVVAHLSRGLRTLSEGVLTETITADFPDQYLALRSDYNTAVEALRDALGSVQGTAESIGHGATEISSASDDLSRRTENQAATLEQTAAALDQLLSIVSKAATSAREVETSVQSASTMAAQNGAVMQSAVDAMSEIEKSSGQIGEIITVIDDIAFQTNLLALNAGVEAARAGASGKGFAVVASEVRALAQRSSDAAQQIKQLVGNSTNQVKDGVGLVERAGQALNEVVREVDHISELMSGIANGASEQAEGLKEINVGVTNLDRVTQQNAAMVEQSTAAAHMLTQSVNDLTQQMSRFSISGHASAVVATPMAEMRALKTGT